MKNTIYQTQHTAMLSINDLNPGTAILFNGQPHIVVSRDHGSSGRGGGFMRTKLKNLSNGAIIDNTFKGNDKIAEADLERSQGQFLYFDSSADGPNAAMMNMTTYEQFNLPKDQIGDQAHYLTEGMTVDILSYQGKPMTVSLPIKVDLMVTYTEPGFKGNTASNTLKPATVETGATVQVPLFVQQGDVIKIDTRTGDYLERVKK